MEDKFIQVSANMCVTKEGNKKIDYIVIKIGGKTYSTTFETFPSKDIEKAKTQITETKNVGEQENLWIKGQFTEEENHKKLETPIPFEINIYSQLPDKSEKQMKI